MVFVYSDCLTPSGSETIFVVKVSKECWTEFKEILCDKNENQNKNNDILNNIGFLPLYGHNTAKTFIKIPQKQRSHTS